MQERRKYVRSNGLVLVNYKAPELSLEGKSSAFDVCGGGLRITTNQKLDKGTAVEVEIYLPGNSQPILAKGEVSWSDQCKETAASKIVLPKPYFYTGITFTVIDQKNTERITSYVHRKLH